MNNNCSHTKTYIKTHHHVYLIKNKHIEFDKERRFCQECDMLVYDNVLDNLASEEAISIYHKLYGVDIKELINLRKKYDLSIELFAKIIGCAKKTLISYEQNKSIPNDTYMITIKTLINNPEVIRMLIESDKGRFSSKEYAIIAKKIYPIIGKNALLLSETKRHEPTVYNGYTELIQEKLNAVILYLCKQKISKTKLMKLLFYIDFSFYKENSCSVTGLEYARLTFGPVPDDYELLIDNFVNKGAIRYENEGDNQSVTAIDNSNLDQLNNKEIALINSIVLFFKDYDAKKITAFSHQEKGWKETAHSKIISYDYAFELQDINK